MHRRVRLSLLLAGLLLASLAGDAFAGKDGIPEVAAEIGHSVSKGSEVTNPFATAQDHGGSGKDVHSLGNGGTGDPNHGDWAGPRNNELESAINTCCHSPAEFEKVKGLYNTLQANGKLTDEQARVYGPMITNLGKEPATTGTAGVSPKQTGKENIKGGLGAGNLIGAANVGAQVFAGMNVGVDGSGPSVSAGNAFIEKGQYAEGERIFRGALAADPKDLGAQQGLAQSLYQQGRTEEATAVVKKMLEQDPDNKFAQVMAGQAAGVQKASTITDKFKKLTQGIWKGPSEVALGAGAQAGEQSPAGRAAQAAARLSGAPQGGAAAVSASGAAAVSAAGGALQPRLTAQQIADQANAARSGPAPIVYAPLVQKGVTRREMGDYTGALFVLTQAVDENPKDALAWTVRAEVDNALKSFPAAIKDAGTALALKPVEAISARALRARAYAHMESGELQQALADINRAIELEARNGLGFLYRAMIEERSGMAEQAARDLETAVRLDPSLEPLAAPLRERLGLSGGQARPKARLDRRLIRGGAIAVSLLLVLLGLLGTARGRELTRRWATPMRAAEDAPADLTPDTVLGGTYRIVKELGRGGMGVVYEGLDETLQRRVAIKRLQREALGSAEDLERFLREARLVAQLKHPNVAEIYTVVMESEPFLVFEYVDGKSLDKVLRINKTMPVPAVRRLVGEVSSALAAAHARGIIHRDLKPANVMMVGDGSAKVMDFGVAHQARAATGPTLTAAAGTPPYMAPEQGLGSVSKASDLYALGVMTYELLSGERPFEGPDFLDAKLQRRYEPISRRSGGLPAGLDAFFARALEPDPTKRHADAAAFSVDFERACG